MAKISFLFLAVFFAFVSSSCVAQPCNTHRFSNGKEFAACNDLPVLDSTLHWNYHPSSHTVDLAFRHAGNNENRWVAWAINPTSRYMIGSQALVAFRRTDGTLAAYTSPITSYATQLQEGNLSFVVHDVSALYEDNEVVIFATLELPNNTTIVNHVWQEGPLSGDIPMRHGLTGSNVQSYGTLDFISGKIEATSSSSSTSKLKIVHGVMNTLSWGFLMPVGAVIARYLKVFQVADPAWFYIHVTCQCLAYLIGVGGSIIGFWLGSQSSGIQHSSHRNIGITLLVLATSQIVVAATIRPHKGSKRRIYFNIFHHSVGYGTIILSSINCFIGLAILDSFKILKIIYIAIIVSLGCVALLLEIFTCIVVMKRKSKELAEKRTMETPV